MTIGTDTNEVAVSPARALGARGARLQRWESRTETPLMLSAVLFLVAYAIPIIWPSSSTDLTSVCSFVVAVTWVALGVDYAVRLAIAPRRWRFVRSNLLDLAALALPLLRPLRLLRLVALLSVLNRAGASTLRGRVATYVAGGSALLVFAGALAITDAERRSPEANITGFGDGLWWAITTVTTVGYGDRYPVTTTGRIVALALMIGGVALLGVVTATLASWLVERVRADSEEEATATRTQVAELTDQVRLLTAHLEREHRASGEGDIGQEGPSDSSGAPTTVRP
jgi:voltage-gated potassium channel